jgi:hypothetical protein
MGAFGSTLPAPEAGPIGGTSMHRLEQVGAAGATVRDHEASYPPSLGLDSASRSSEPMDLVVTVKVAPLLATPPPVTVTVVASAAMRGTVAVHCDRRLASAPKSTNYN